MAFSLCSGGIAVAQQQFELKRPFHPRLETTPQEIEQLREDKQAVAEARSAADGVLRLERTTSYKEYYVSLPAAELPPTHDDKWPYWTGLCSNLGGYLHTTARAYAITRDEKYKNWCLTLMRALAAWKQWTDPDYGSQPCLDTHSLTRGMCLAYDYLYNDLSPAERDRLRKAIVTKGAEFIYEYGNDEKSYVQHPDAWPNGYAMINTELGVAGLTFLGEEDDAQAWLAQALDKVRWFFDEEGGVDGGLIEGFGYGSAAIDNFMYLLQAAYRVTGADMFDHPYLARAIYFPAYFVAPGGGSVANFGDNGGAAGCSPTLRGLARALMEIRQSSVAAWYLKKAGETDDEVERLARPPEELPLGRHFRDIDWVALRSGWGSADSLLAFKCGHVAHHNHLDQNSFILACGSEWLLNDPGYQIYDRPYPPERKMTMETIHRRHEYTYGTPGHNAILVDGKGQGSKRGHIIAFATTHALGYAVGDASDPYQDTLKTYRRHVVSVPPNYYVVFDEIETNGPERKIEILLHTTPDGRFTIGGAPSEVGDERHAREVSVARSEGEAVIRFAQPGEMAVAHKQWPDCEGYGHFLSVSSSQPMTKGIIAWGLRAGPCGSTSLELRSREASEEVSAVQVRLRGGVDTLVLNVGGEPVTVDELAFDGACALVRKASGGGIGRYGLVAGKSLNAGDVQLVSSDSEVTVGALQDPDAGLFQADIEAKESATVTLRCTVAADLVKLDGIEEPIDVSLSPEKAEVMLTVPAGRYALEMRSL